MKKFIFILLSVLAFGFTSCNNDDDGIPIIQVPTEVVVAFNTQFAYATDVEYSRFGDQYVIYFDLNSVEHEAIYNSNGTLVKYKYDISTTEVPQEILTSLANDYDNKPIDDAEIVVIDDINYYQIELDDSPLDDKLVFNANGTINTSLVYWD